MNKQEYLNQISATSKPMKPGDGSFISRLFASKIFWICLAAIAGFILILVIGSVISGAKGNVKDNTYALKIHINNTTNVMDDYRKKVKSSDLRSDGATLSSLLLDLDGKLENYINEKYGINGNEVSKKLNSNKVDELNLERDGLESELYEAKINGILDRIYARKMSYEIAMIMTEEKQISDASGDEDLKNILSTSYSSLENLYDKVSNFSEAK